MGKLKLTAKRQDIDSFSDKFYIIESGSMYCLMLVDSHGVLISQPTLPLLLKSTNDLLHKYQTFGNLIRSMRKCDFPPTKVPSAILSKRQKMYKKEGSKYENELKHVIEMFDTFTEGKLKEKTKVKPLIVKKKIIKKRA